jgi:ankyrin repeat protein
VCGRAGVCQVLRFETSQSLRLLQLGWQEMLRQEAKLGNVEATEALLVEKNFDINGADEHGITALHIAAFRGFTGVAAALLDHGADVNCRCSNETPLSLAVAGDRMQAVDLLLARGADPTIVGMGGCSLLHSVARTGNVQLAETLLSDYGMDICARDDEGLLPFHVALATDPPSLGVADTLLAHGQDVNARGGGTTAVHWLCIAGDASTAHRYYKQHGLDPNAAVQEPAGRCAPSSRLADVRRAPPRQLVVLTGFSLCNGCFCHELGLRSATDRGGRVTKGRLEPGMSALHVAILETQLQMVMMLSKIGASLQAQNLDGHTPMQMADLNGKRDIVGVLKEGYADSHVLLDMQRQAAVCLWRRPAVACVHALFVVRCLLFVLLCARGLNRPPVQARAGSAAEKSRWLVRDEARQPDGKTGIDAARGKQHPSVWGGEAGRSCLLRVLRHDRRVQSVRVRACVVLFARAQDGPSRGARTRLPQRGVRQRRSQVQANADESAELYRWWRRRRRRPSCRN